MNHITRKGKRPGARSRLPALPFFKLALKASISFNLVPVSAVTLHMFKRGRVEKSCGYKQGIPFFSPALKPHCHSGGV